MIQGLFGGLEFLLFDDITVEIPTLILSTSELSHFTLSYPGPPYLQKATTNHSLQSPSKQQVLQIADIDRLLKVIFNPCCLHGVLPINLKLSTFVCKIMKAMSKRIKY